MNELSLRQKFMKVLVETAPGKAFVVFPNEQETKFLKFVDIANQDILTQQDENFLMGLTVQEIALFRKFVDYSNNFYMFGNTNALEMRGENSER